METLNNDETQLYDRQIRLWGMDAQNRLRNSSVLLAGMSGLGAEIAKNLMLSGLKTLTIMDDKEITEADYSTNFLLVRGTKMNRAEASCENLKLLNPMVDINVQMGSVEAMPSEFYSNFDLVIVVDHDFETTNSINKKCRQNRIRFEAASVFGWVGYAFFDFNNHIFLIPKPREKAAIIESVLDGDDEDGQTEEAGASGLPKRMKMNGAELCGPFRNEHQPVTMTIGDEDSKIKKNVPFPSFEHTFGIEFGPKRFRRKFNIPSTYFVVRAFFDLMRTKVAEAITCEEAIDQWKKELSFIGSDESKQKVTADDFHLFVGPALNPVCAIVGSVIAQEAIKSLSQNDEPLKNTFFYSALESCGTVVDLAS